MKLVWKSIDKKNQGSVSLVAEEAEDMWHAYNLISIDDTLRSTTVRRVVNESSVGLTSTSRVHTKLTIMVKSMDYDTQASVLRVKGTNVEENQFVKMGAYHTIDLELNKNFVISKHEWDSVALNRIEEACDPAHSADLAAVVMQEGLANVCLILSSMTIVKAKVEMNIPRKRKGQCSNHDKSLEKFFERIIQALLTHINFDIVKAVIVASPGFIKDQFFAYMNDYVIKNIQTAKVLLDNKSKFVLVHSASGFKHSLKEIFEDPNLAPRLTDTKALGEVKSLDSFYQMLKTEPSRAFYGYKHVEKASEADAVDVLLITDSLFRSKELAERKKYVNIVDRVRENNGTVKIFSSLHVSGEQLLQLTGVAAILRFPMPDLEDEVLSDSDDDNDEFTTTGHVHLATNGNGNKMTSSVHEDLDGPAITTNALNGNSKKTDTSATGAAAKPANPVVSLFSKLPEGASGSSGSLPVTTSGANGGGSSQATTSAAAKTPAAKKNKKTNKENYNDEDEFTAYKNGRDYCAYDDYDDY